MKKYDEQKWKAFRQSQVDHLVATADAKEKDGLLKKSLLRLVDLKFNKEDKKAALEDEAYPLADAEFYLTDAVRSHHVPLNSVIATALAEGKLSAGKGVKLMGIKSAQEKREALVKEGLIQ